MDNSFVLCPNILGLLALILLLVFTRINFYLDDKKLKLFVAAALVNIAVIVMEVTDYFLGQTPFEAAYLIRRITSAGGFALSPLIPLLISYIAAQKKLSRWILIPALLNAVISFASIATGHLFYIDSCNSYYRGPLFVLMMAISAFYLLLLIYVSFRNLKGAHSNEAVFLFGIAVVIILANVLEIAFSFHFVIWNCCGIFLLAYFLFLHIQYFKFDQMTGVFNRSMFNFNVGRIKSGSNIGIVSFDLNGLKKINDTQGHEEGDKYIIASAELIVRCFSNVGRVYRIGGDEFVVLMANTSASTIDEKIRLFDDTCKEAGVSVACGYAFTDKAEDISQMLRNADNEMRNRIIYR